MITFTIEQPLDAEDIAQALASREPEQIEQFATELVNALDEYSGIIAASYFANGATEAQIKLCAEAVGPATAKGAE